MLEDYLVAASAAIITAVFVLLVLSFKRQKQLTKAYSSPADLVKGLSTFFENRLKRQDERIIDLMAKVELLAVRFAHNEAMEDIPKVKDDLAKVISTKSVTELEPKAPPKLNQHVSPRFGSTEKTVLRLLSNGPKTSVEIMKEIGRSREHSARLMKVLYDEGFMIRDDATRPFVYSITESGRRYLAET